MLRFMLLAVLCVTVASCAPWRAADAIKLLSDLSAAPDAGADSSVTVRPRGYVVDGRSGTGDLYVARERPLAALVIVPGAAPEGKDDPRLVAFARALAKSRFVVFVPDIANLRALRLSAADAIPVGDAIRFLACTTGAGEVGLVGISYAAGPALLAAHARDGRSLVRFVLTIGGYYSVNDVVTFFTTGMYRAPGSEQWRHRRPNAYGMWLLVRSAAERIEDPHDRALLRQMARRKLENLDADISDLAASLGPDGLAVYELLQNRDPERVPALIAALPRPVRDDLAALDLSRIDLTELGARVILVHGRDDPIVPYTESLALAAAIPRERRDLYVIDSLSHVRLGTGGIADAFRLYRAAYAVIEARDALPPPVADDTPLPQTEACARVERTR